MKKMFRFKQFDISDSRSPMKVGTDGVLLGAWCDVPDEGNVLDIGTGCGIIALMVAQRSHRVQITAIDIDEGSVADARENVAASPWNDRMEVRQTGFADFAAEQPNGSFEAIVSNPPYFINSLTPPDKGRENARHASALNPRELAAGGAKLLSPNGTFSLILPPGEAERFVDIAKEFELYAVRRTSVCYSPGSPPKRILIQMRRGNTAEAAEDVLVIHDDSRQEFSEKYRPLTRDFYLKF